jgi:limonene-1,2-epoxide hydrolase
VVKQARIKVLSVHGEPLVDLGLTTTLPTPYPRGMEQTMVSRRTALVTPLALAVLSGSCGTTPAIVSSPLNASKESTMTTPNPIFVAETFFSHWSADRFDQAIAMLADDVLYDNVPFPDIVGRENVRKFHADFGLGTSFKPDWKVVNIAASGDVVLNERVDVFTHETGGTITLPVMGTITVVDGKITVWRDYFDPGDFDRQLKLIKR